MKRRSQLGIKMLERLVQPPERDPSGSAKHEQPRDQQPIPFVNKEGGAQLI